MSIRDFYAKFAREGRAILAIRRHPELRETEPRRWVTKPDPDRDVYCLCHDSDTAPIRLVPGDMPLRVPCWR